MFLFCFMQVLSENGRDAAERQDLHQLNTAVACRVVRKIALPSYSHKDLRKLWCVANLRHETSRYVPELRPGYVDWLDVLPTKSPTKNCKVHVATTTQNVVI